MVERIALMAMFAALELLFDKVEWATTGLESEALDEQPVATHTGILKIGEREIRVYKLSDGNRVANPQDVERLFSGK